MRKILLVFAHPDDESFTGGGTVAKYVQSGWTAELICATRGESGHRGPYVQADAHILGEIRKKELEYAAEIVGISKVTFLGFKDGALKSVNPGEIEDKLFKLFITDIPDIVITFEPGGISNHPDHIKLTVATTVAFQKYAQAIDYVRMAQVSADNPPRHARDRWQISFAQSLGADFEPKLYYACLPQSIAEYLIKHQAIPSKSFDKSWSTTPDKLVTSVIDVSKFTNKKVRALKSHVTQQADINRFLSLSNQPLLVKEYFILRYHGTREVIMGKNDRVSNRL